MKTNLKNDFDSINKQILNVINLAMAIAAFPAFFASFSRFQLTGFKLIYLFEFIVLIAFWILFVLKDKLKFKYRVIAFISLLVILELVSIPSFNSQSYGGYTVILISFLAGFFYGQKAGFISIFLSSLYVLIVFYSSPEKQELFYFDNFLITKASVSFFFKLIFIILLSSIIVFSVSKYRIYFQSTFKNLKRVKKQNVEHQTKFKNLSNYTFEGILIHNEGIAIDMNLSFAKMFGYKQAELLNKNLIKLLIPNQYHKLLLAKLENQKSVPYEIEGRRKDGTIFPLEIEGRIMRNKNTFRVTAVRDITERKKNEKLNKQNKEYEALNKELIESKAKIAEKEQELRNILENTSNLFYSHTQEHVLTYMSSQVKNILGYTHEEVMFKWTELASDNPINEIGFQNTQRAIDTGISQIPFELELLHKNGEKIWVEVREAPVLENGKTVSIVGALVDVTKRKKAEQEIQKQNEELQKLNATKDKFFSIIAHDLKSPFNAMIGFTTLLAKNFDKYEIKQQKEYIDYIQEGMQNTHKLLDNLLNWSRMQSGKFRYEPKQENLFLLINESILLLNQAAVNKTINITNNTPEKFEIQLDRNMISTTIRNLISNAIKFTHKNGKITIEATTIKDKKNLDCVKISIIDNGIGIVPKKLSTMFEISKNISTRGTDGETGTGLGLILCKEFIEKHGGKIWVESEVGKGTTFFITIPL